MPSLADEKHHDGLAPLSFRDELANTVSHGVGLLLAVAAAATIIVSVILKGDAWHIAGCAIYAATLVSLYAVSTLSHAIQEPSRRRVLRILDQAFIFLLIAGTYTPFAIVHLADGWWAVLAGVWIVAFSGFFAKILSGQHRLGFGSMITYLCLGWIPGAILIPIMGPLPFGGLWWLLAGGLCYTLGTVFLVLDHKIPLGHMIWHLFVIAGSGCHYFPILCYSGSPF